MPIEIRCESCGKRYRVEDRFAGKRVKCRNCEAGIPVPAASGDDSLQDLAALGEALPATLEDSEISPSPLSSLAVGLPQEVEVPAVPTLPAGFGPALHAARSRVGTRRFSMTSYPGARAIDVGLPWVLGLACLIPTIWQGSQIASAQDPQWIAFTQYGIIFLLFLVLVIPLTLRGLRMSGQMLHFDLPSTALWRTLGIFSLPLALGAMFYWQLDFDFSGLLLGLVAGLLAAGPLILFVMHLHWVEAAVAWMMSALFFCGAAAVTAGVAFVVGLIIVASTNTPAKLPTKTLVKVPVKPPVVVATTEPAEETPTTSPTTEPAVATTDPGSFFGVFPVKPPPPPVTQPVIAPPKIEVVKIELSPIVTSAKEMDWLPSVDAVLRSQVGNTPLAIVTRTPDRERVQIVNAAHDGVVGEVSFKKDPAASDRYVINPEGDLVLRTVSWPKLSVQVLSTVPGRNGRIIDLDETFGNATLLGVTSTDQLFIQRERGGQHGIEIWNIRTATRARPLSQPVIVENGLAISPDGKYIAVATKIDGQAMVQLTNSAGGVKRIPIKRLDSKWPLEPVAITFSPDSSRLAICFEHDSGLLIVAWSTAGASQLYEQIYLPGTLTIPPRDQFKGRALDWVGEDASSWLLYGRLVIDPQSGNTLGNLGVANVVKQQVIDGKNVDLETTLVAGGKRIVHVELNTDLLTKSRIAATQPVK